MLTKRYLYFTVFASGLTALAIEISASRLLGNVFGASNLVWATIIGLILVYLAIGYFIGGRWADRYPYPQVMLSILAWAAFSAALAPFVSRPVLRLAADAFDQLQMGFLFGSFLTVLVLFAVPVTLMGTSSPFAIRLAIGDVNSSGQVSGNLYAVSTLGSFIGTFIPPIVLIPLLGTTLTFLCFSLFLLGVSFVGLWLVKARRRLLSLAWMPVVVLALMALTIGKPIKTSEGQIYETESAYNYIQVLEINGYRLLRLNEGQGIHSMWHPSQVDYAGPWEQFLAAPFFNSTVNGPGQVKNMAIIGLAAGTAARQATEVFGPLSIDGYEIDPKIIAVGKEFFDMNEPNLNPIAEDGRWGLQRSQKKYDLIALDAYRPPYIPWQLTTREFFQEVKDHLAEDGVVVMNVGSDPKDRRLLDGLIGTLQSVFPSVYLMDVPETFNYILYASAQPTRQENIYQNYLNLSAQEGIHPLLLASIRRFIENQQPIGISNIVFTDDRAPVEWITNTMVLNYLFQNKMEPHP